MNKAHSIIETGLARCVTEPRGQHGLEGYGLGQTYRFERCQDVSELAGNQREKSKKAPVPIENSVFLSFHTLTDIEC